MLYSILTILMIVLAVYSLYIVQKWHKVGNKYDMLADELKKEVVTNEKD